LNITIIIELNRLSFIISPGKTTPFTKYVAICNQWRWKKYSDGRSAIQAITSVDTTREHIKRACDWLGRLNEKLDGNTINNSVRIRCSEVTEYTRGHSVTADEEVLTSAGMGVNSNTRDVRTGNYYRNARNGVNAVGAIIASCIYTTE